MADAVKSRENEPIQEGDHVWTKLRGGRHEGDVDKVVVKDKEAAEEGVKHPPKVVFEDQHGHRVSHNPGTLTKTEEGKKD